MKEVITFIGYCTGICLFVGGLLYKVFNVHSMFFTVDWYVLCGALLLIATFIYDFLKK
jgi:hypothetical protein